MTIDEAIDRVYTLSHLDSRQDNESVRADIATLIEQTKKRDLQAHWWKFARDKLTVDIPFPLYHYEHANTENDYRYFQALLLFDKKVVDWSWDMDFFTARHKGFSSSDILEVYTAWSIVLDVDKGLQSNFHHLRKDNKIFDVTGDHNIYKPYIDNFIDIYNDKNYIKRKNDVLIIVNSDNRHLYDPAQAIDNVNLPDYIEKRNTVYNEVKRLMTLFPAGFGLDAAKAMLDKYGRHKLQYKIDLNVECTVDVPLESCPEEFAHIICIDVAKTKAISSGNHVGASQFHSEYLRLLHNLKQQYSTEHDDLPIIENQFQYNHSQEERSLL